MLDALSPQRRRLVLGLVVLGVVVLLAVAATVVVRRVADSFEPVPQDQPGPVLLVTGYGGGLDSLVGMSAALRAAGRTVRIVPVVGDGTGDLDAQAEQVGEVARAVLAETGAPSVDLVGYSAGGVVVRLWVRAHGGDRLTRRVLTIGSPQHGTRQAELGSELAGGCPPACEQLVPGSDLLRRLNAGDETPRGPAWVTVRSATDEVVTPVDSAMLDGAVNLLVQDLCPGSTTDHGQLPDAPATLAVLTSALGAAPPAAPASVTC